MNIFRWIAVSFSLYSKVPMPIFDWEDKDMKYNLIFFPWIGILVGGVSYGIWYLLTYFELPVFVMIPLLAVIPIIITGGFHIDGFMDVEDARRSYADREKKLEILKDPHIGAFAVIGLVKILLLYGAGLGIVINYGDSNIIIIYGFIFMLSRCISGISANMLKKAKKEGMLYQETKSGGNVVTLAIAVQLITALIIMCFVNLVASLFVLLGLVICLVYYRIFSYKEFGGVTGDTAGYLVVISETAMCLMIALYMLIFIL